MTSASLALTTPHQISGLINFRAFRSLAAPEASTPATLQALDRDGKVLKDFGGISGASVISFDKKSKTAEVVMISDDTRATGPGARFYVGTFDPRNGSYSNVKEIFITDEKGEKAKLDIEAIQPIFKKDKTLEKYRVTIEASPTEPSRVFDISPEGKIISRAAFTAIDSAPNASLEAFVRIDGKNRVFPKGTELKGIEMPKVGFTHEKPNDTGVQILYPNGQTVIASYRLSDVNQPFRQTTASNNGLVEFVQDPYTHKLYALERQYTPGTSDNKGNVIRVKEIQSLVRPKNLLNAPVLNTSTRFESGPLNFNGEAGFIIDGTLFIISDNNFNPSQGETLFMTVPIKR